MVRSALGKIAWVGRTASMVFGLALVMALVLGVATTAMGANGQNFILGKAKNAATKVTGLVGNVDGASLRVTNPNTGTNDTALSLNVQAGEAPMKVNSAGKVANLNADQLDGRDSADFAAKAEAPGVDSTTFDSSLTLTSSLQNVTSVTVTAPADGFVMVTGSGTFASSNHVQGTQDFLRAFLTRQSGTSDFSTLEFFSVPASAPPGEYGAPFSITRVYPVTAGDHTFYLTADKFSGVGRISRANITAVFVKNGF